MENSIEENNKNIERTARIGRSFGGGAAYPMNDDPGMTALQVTANAALTGILSSPDGLKMLDEHGPEVVSHAAFELAGAMMREQARLFIVWDGGARSD